MSLPFLFHSQTVDGLAFDGKRVKVCLKTEALTFDAVYARIEPDNEEYLVAMVQCGRVGELLLWEVSFEPNRDRDITHYVFKVVRNGQQYWLDARGVQKRIPPKEFHFKLNVNHQPPKWVQEQVFYQIFS